MSGELPTPGLLARHSVYTDTEIQTDLPHSVSWGWTDVNSASPILIDIRGGGNSRKG